MHGRGTMLSESRHGQQQRPQAAFEGASRPDTRREETHLERHACERSFVFGFPDDFDARCAGGIR